MRTLIGLLVLVAAACGGGDTAKMQKYRDAMCNCKDRDCTKQVEADNEEFLKSLGGKYKSKDDAPKDLAELADEAKKCRRAARDGGSSKEGGGNGAAIAKMTEYKDKVCACKDMACATKVNTEMGPELAKMGNEKPSEADMKQLSELSSQMSKCMTALAATAK